MRGTLRDTEGTGTVDEETERPHEEDVGLLLGLLWWLWWSFSSRWEDQEALEGRRGSDRALWSGDVSFSPRRRKQRSMEERDFSASLRVTFVAVLVIVFVIVVVGGVVLYRVEWSTRWTVVLVMVEFGQSFGN